MQITNNWNEDKPIRLRRKKEKSRLTLILLKWLICWVNILKEKLIEW